MKSADNRLINEERNIDTFFCNIANINFFISKFDLQQNYHSIQKKLYNKRHNEKK